MFNRKANKIKELQARIDRTLILHDWWDSYIDKNGIRRCLYDEQPMPCETEVILRGIKK